MLELTEVVKHYGDVTALDGCTFTARPGRLTGLLGPNGAGKTTAMRAISKMDDESTILCKDGCDGGAPMVE